METENGSYSVEDEQHFWTQLHDLIRTKCDTHEAIDDVLRSYLGFTSTFQRMQASSYPTLVPWLTHSADYLSSDYDLARCCYALLGSEVFQQNREYVRRQFIYGLLQVR